MSIKVHGVVWREIANANVSSQIQLIHSESNSNPIRERLVQKFTPID
jgi:hypothetical protein